MVRGDGLDEWMDGWMVAGSGTGAQSVSQSGQAGLGCQGAWTAFRGFESVRFDSVSTMRIDFALRSVGRRSLAGSLARARSLPLSLFPQKECRIVWVS